MKKIVFFLLIVLAGCFFLAYQNNNPEHAMKALLKQGEIKTNTLTYRAYLFGLLPVGEATYELKGNVILGGENVYHLSASASSLKLFSNFFKASAVLDSYVDPKILSPIMFKQVLKMSGKPDIEKEITYDQRAHVMTLAGVRRQILERTQDPLSAMFNLRSIDFDKAKEVVMSLNTNQENYTLKGEVTLKAMALDNSAYRLAILKGTIGRSDKNPYHKSSVTLTLLRDKENIPLLVRFFASGFVVQARLIRTK